MIAMFQPAFSDRRWGLFQAGLQRNPAHLGNFKIDPHCRTFMHQHKNPATVAMMITRMAHRFHFILKPHHGHGPVLLDNLALGLQARNHIRGIK